MRNCAIIHPLHLEVETAKFYFVLSLQAFLQAFRIFKAFFNERLRIMDPGWEASIEKLNARLEQLR